MNDEKGAWYENRHYERTSGGGQASLSSAQGFCKGFTLAEVLITLGIIGVVAALTLPSLIANHQEKQTVSRLKKFYSVMSSAYKRALAEDGSPDTWGLAGMYDEESHRITARKLMPYLNVLVDCTDMTSEEVKEQCSTFLGDNSTAMHFVLADGTTAVFRHLFPTCNAAYGVVKNVCGLLAVDINGKSKPNAYGKDIFWFHYTKDRIVPHGIEGDSLTFEKGCNKSVETHSFPGYGGYNMFTCTAWVLYNENMDYWKCDDLSWSGKKKCSK